MPHEIDNQIIELPIDEIVVGATMRNIRTYFSDDETKELAETIYHNGMAVPLVIMDTEKDGVPITELVCGARRLRAAQYILAAFDEDWNDGKVPCRVFTGAVEDASFLNASENIDRKDVDDVDVGSWINWQIESLGRPIDEIAGRLRRTVQWVSSRLVVHRQGTEAVKAALREGVIGITAAYALAKDFSAEEQDKRVEQARKNGDKITALALETERKSTLARPGKKALGVLLAEATKSASNPLKRNAHGVMMGLQFCLGMVSEEELRGAINFETEVADGPALEEASRAEKVEEAAEPPAPAKRKRGRPRKNAQ